MNVLVTLPRGSVGGNNVFPEEAVEIVEGVGNVTYNETDDKLSREALIERLPGADVLVTRWNGCPRLTEDLMAHADDLEYIGHVGGSLNPVVTDAVFDRDVRVSSAIRVMAAFVAETTLGHVLASLRTIPQYTSALQDGGWERDTDRLETLFDAQVGLVGLGSVGRELLMLLEPFDVEVSVYDPYVDPDDLVPFDFAEKTSLDRALEDSDVVSVHAAKTEETLHLLDGERLGQLDDGALLVNTARGAIIDEAALVAELESGRISAALDVFESEPLPDDSPLRSLDNAVLTPHVGGASTGSRMGLAMAEEVARYANGEPLAHEISRERYHTMTKNWLSADDVED